MIDRDGAMDPLDPGLRVAERRDQLAVAERPVGAAEPGIGGADDDADRDQPESGREGERGELLEAVHEALILPRRRVPTDRDTLSAMTPRRWLPLLVLLVLIAAACGVGAARRAAPVRRPRCLSGARRADAAEAARPGPRHERDRQGQGADPVPVPRRQERGRERAGPDGQGRLLRPRHATRPRPSTTADGAFVWTIENERGMYVVDADLPTAGNWGAEFTTEAPGSPAETVRLTFPVRDSTGDRPGRREGPGIEDPDRRRRRRRPHQDLDRHEAGPGLLPDLGRRRARRPQAVHARLRHARSSAPASSAARRSTTSSRSRRPTRRSRSSTSSHTSSRSSTARSSRSSTPTTSSRRPPSPTSGACSRSRGSSRSTGTGSSRARTR